MEVLWRKNAAEVASLVKAGKVSAVEVTQATLDRLEQVNGKLNAVVIQTQDDAFRSAHLVDQAIQRGEDPGLLAGVPVTVKVSFSTGLRKLHLSNPMSLGSSSRSYISFRFVNRMYELS